MLFGLAFWRTERRVPGERWHLEVHWRLGWSRAEGRIRASEKMELKVIQEGSHRSILIVRTGLVNGKVFWIEVSDSLTNFKESCP